MKLIKSFISYFLPSVITQSQISEAVSEAFKETFKEIGYRIGEHHHKKEREVVDENCIGYEEFEALERAG